MDKTKDKYQDWRGFTVSSKPDESVGHMSSESTHKYFQSCAGTCAGAEINRLQSLPPWGPSNWRYDPVTGGEIRMKDGHGNRMNGN